MKRILLYCISLVFVLGACSLIKSPSKDSKKTIEAPIEAELPELTLKEQIATYAAVAREKIPEAAKQTMISATDKLRKSNMSSDFLKVGDEAPDFDLDSLDGTEYDLHDLLKKGPVVISFYRGGWCPYCNLELRALNKIYPEIKAKGAELIAISPEMPDRASVTANKNTLAFPLLYDRKAKVADEYNLVFELDDSLKPIYKSFGIDLEQVNGDDDWELPVPATYVVGQDRKIKFAFADVDYKNRAEPADILEML